MSQSDHRGETEETVIKAHSAEKNLKGFQLNITQKGKRRKSHVTDSRQFVQPHRKNTQPTPEPPSNFKNLNQTQPERLNTSVVTAPLHRHAHEPISGLLKDRTM